MMVKSMTTNWNTDEGFLEFLSQKLESDGTNLLAKLVDSPEDILLNSQLLDEMRAGTDRGQTLYLRLHRVYGTEFYNGALSPARNL